MRSKQNRDADRITINLQMKSISSAVVCYRKKSHDESKAHLERVAEDRKAVTKKTGKKFRKYF